MLQRKSGRSHPPRRCTLNACHGTFTLPLFSPLIVFHFFSFPFCWLSLFWFYFRPHDSSGYLLILLHFLFPLQTFAVTDEANFQVYKLCPIQSRLKLSATFYKNAACVHSDLHLNTRSVITLYLPSCLSIRISALFLFLCTLKFVHTFEVMMNVASSGVNYCRIYFFSSFSFFPKCSFFCPFHFSSCSVPPSALFPLLK